MIKKILITLAAVILMVLPFLAGNPLGKYTPYIEGNSYQLYVLVWAGVSIAVTAVVLLLFKYYFHSKEGLPVTGIFLFLLVCPIAGIVGLVSPPDLSVNMLAHPEREHVRYLFLFLGAVLFGCFCVVFLNKNSSNLNKAAKWIITILFILAFAEFIWEFNHHYFYPEALKEWMSKGNTFETFGKKYDNINVINLGVIGRIIQFSLITWLSIFLYRMKQIKLWTPVITILFSVTAIVAAIVIYVTEMNFPKGFEMLFLFFIPGIPFLTLYFLGVGLLTKLKKSETAY